MRSSQTSNAEKVLFEYFDVPIQLVESDPIGCYKIAVDRAFLSNEQTPYVDALRRGYDALVNVKGYRMTPEFEQLIQIRK
jgi:hypothetical protein